MDKPHVVIVDDEQDIADLLKLNLVADGFEVTTFDSGAQVVDQVARQRPDIILLDVMMPNKDGFTVCKELKANPVTAPIPVIFLTAKTLEHNVVSGLEIGADDYITKPFSLSVVISRIKAVLRRANASIPVDSTEGPVITARGIVMDTRTMGVQTPHGPARLNATEFALLKTLVQQPGWVFKRSQLMDACKGDDVFVTDRSIDVIMVAIRKKLGAHAHVIETVRGVGYKLRVM
jgi:two-component system alkaline phosphatase synthesis response regulator PhoP